MPSSGSNGGSRVLPNLPAGFRFHPTDEELIVHYLMNQAASIPCPVPIIAEVNIYHCNPWDLPAKALFGENEWYFFSPRDRKYPNGVRPNRAAGSGYWKATGTDKAILSTPASEHVGVKKALVFYSGRPPKGVKTDWIMHEYRLTGTAAAAHGKHSTTKRRGSSSSSSSSSSMRLDDWVLCRIHKKSNDFQTSDQDQHEGSTVEEDYTTTFNNSITSTEETFHLGHQLQSTTAAMMTTTTMSKSCSLTDLLNTLDYAELSQMLLPEHDDDDAPAAEADQPQQSSLVAYPAAQASYSYQAPNHNNSNNVHNNSHTNLLLPAAVVVDHAAVGSDNGGAKRKRVMAAVVDDGAAESFDDGGDSSSKKLKLPVPGDSRSGHFGTTTTSSYYCNQQQQLVGGTTTTSGFQYSSLLMSNPFFNQQLLLNNHIEMQ